MKKDVVLNEIKNELNLKERDVDKIVLKCYYNICKYYNKDIEIIYNSTIIDKHNFNQFGFDYLLRDHSMHDFTKVDFKVVEKLIDCYSEIEIKK